MPSTTASTRNHSHLKNLLHRKNMCQQGFLTVDLACMTYFCVSKQKVNVKKKTIYNNNTLILKPIITHMTSLNLPAKKH